VVLVDKKNREEAIEIVQESIMMYFDEKKIREKPKDNSPSYFMIVAGGAAALYMIYQMSVFFKNF